MKSHQCCLLNKIADFDEVAIAAILKDSYQYQLVYLNFETRVILDRNDMSDRLQSLLTNILPNQIKPTKSDRLRYHPVFKNPETEEQKQACQTCYDYVWHPEVGAEKLYFNAGHPDAYYHRAK